MMKDAILIIAVMGIFLFSFRVMIRLDKALIENHRTISVQTEAKEPSCILLTEEVSDEEIAEEIRRFRSCHHGVRILLYDSDAPEDAGRRFNQMQQKLSQSVV